VCRESCPRGERRADAPRFERVEDIPPEFFRPPHCPNENCPTHDPSSGAVFEWDPSGSHVRQSPPFVVPRFCCRACGRDFSLMTFAATYWLKRPELLLPIAAGLVAGSAHRQIARTLGCAPSTVTRLAARIGRHAILLQEATLAAFAQQQPLAEPVVFDDFETFTGAQFFPLAIGTAVARDSALVLDLEPAPHARGGALNDHEKERRRALYGRFGPPPRGERARAFGRILDRLLALAGVERDLVLVTDDHPVYRGVVERHPQRGRIRHRRFPNPRRGPKGAPRTAEARARDEALFEVDQLHRLLRHSEAAHRRETIAFGRRVGALMERAFLFAVWRNLVKNRSERRPHRGTPAMQAGLTGRRWTWREVFRQRLFPSLAPLLPASWRSVYRRDVPTPGAPPQALHFPRYVH
jgi:transposase-like protein